MKHFVFFKYFRRKKSNLKPITEQAKVRLTSYRTHLSEKEAERLVSLELSHEHNIRLRKSDYAEMLALKEKFNKAVK